MTGNAQVPDSSESCELRILVCGGRDYQGKDFIYETLDQLKADLSWIDKTIACIIQGGATGADTLAMTWAITRRIPVITYPANWNKYGKSAGRIRNQQMLDKEHPDIVVAFPGNNGTAHMVEIAFTNNIPVHDHRK